MKCPECVKNGERSQVNVGTESTTLMYYQPYYDEEGVYHYHDMNTVTQTYSCSRGHSWATAIKNRCPCGWVQP